MLSGIVADIEKRAKKGDTNSYYFTDQSRVALDEFLYYRLPTM